MTFWDQKIFKIHDFGFEPQKNFDGQIFLFSCLEHILKVLGWLLKDVGEDRFWSLKNGDVQIITIESRARNRIKHKRWPLTSDNFG